MQKKINNFYNKIIDYLNSKGLKFNIMVAIISLTIFLFLGLYQIYYKSYINDYANIALNDSRTWFKRDYLNVANLMFYKEIEQTTNDIIDSVVNPNINTNLTISERLNLMWLYLKLYLIKAFNYITTIFYRLVLYVEAIAIYVYLIFDKQKNPSEKTTLLAKLILYLTSPLNFAFKKILILIDIIKRFIKRNQNEIKITIICILLLSGWLIKFIIEIINLFKFTNINDDIAAGFECWSFDCIVWFLVIYVRFFWHHKIVNAIVIILSLFAYCDKRAKLNRSKIVKKFNKLFDEVDIHELSR